MADIVVELLHCLRQTLSLQSFFNLCAKLNFTCTGMYMDRKTCHTFIYDIKLTNLQCGVCGDQGVIAIKHWSGTILSRLDGFHECCKLTASGEEGWK